MALPTTLEGLLLAAHQAPVECSLGEIRSYEKFSQLGLLRAISEIEKELTSVGLCIHPPVSEGEVDQKRIVSRKETQEKFTAALEEALRGDEGQEIEFKESLYVKKTILGNHKIPKESWVSEDIVFSCIKTICAFLNSDGGTLLIGVSDAAEVEGIDCELGLVRGGNGTIDKWDLFFSDCLQKYIYEYTQCIGYVTRKIIQRDGKHVCVVLVKPRRSSITVCRSPSDGSAEIVFVRNANGTRELKARAIVELVQSRLSTVP